MTHEIASVAEAVPALPRLDSAPLGVDVADVGVSSLDERDVGANDVVEPTLFDVLPPELLLEVVTFLPTRELASLARVCSAGLALALDESVWRARTLAELGGPSAPPDDGLWRAEYEARRAAAARAKAYVAAFSLGRVGRQASPPPRVAGRRYACMEGPLAAAAAAARVRAARAARVAAAGGGEDGGGAGGGGGGWAGGAPTPVSVAAQLQANIRAASAAPPRASVRQGECPWPSLRA